MESFLKFLLNGFVLFVFISCTSVQKSHMNPNLKGRVLENKYNSMPQIGKPTNTGSPLSTMIYIYEPTKVEQLTNFSGSFCDSITSQFVKSFSSDSLGYYQAKLKPGKYSVFVKYEKAYYIPYFSGANWAALFEIKEKETTELIIYINGLANSQ